MKTGLKLIKKERREQIEKHGFTLSDDQYYKKGELVQAALHCLERIGKGAGWANVYHQWPKNWSMHFRDKIAFKKDIGKLTVAGALYMAENDRLGEPKYKKEIANIAKMINDLV